MNFFIIFFCLASATLQGIYVNKIGNAVASFNANRYRVVNNNNDCNILNQTFNFRKNNAQTDDEVSKLMLAYKKASGNICGSKARPRRQQRFGGFA